MLEVTKGLILELDVQFPKQLVMDGMGIAYPWYSNRCKNDLSLTFGSP
jgi:hypothetical protein